jgi:hypothetical protein
MIVARRALAVNVQAQSQPLNHTSRTVSLVSLAASHSAEHSRKTNYKMQSLKEGNERYLKRNELDV